jgi:hypothetical protein
MKKEKIWIAVFVTISLLIYGLLYVVYILVDPKMIFNTKFIKNHFSYTKYYSKHQYEKLKEERYSLVFGTSRSHKISTRQSGVKLLNFHNIYAEPNEILNFLQQLTDKQIKNIDNIYYHFYFGNLRGEYAMLDYKNYGFINKLNEIFPISKSNINNIYETIKYNIYTDKIKGYIDYDGSAYVIDKTKSFYQDEIIINHINSKKSLYDVMVLNQIGKIYQFAKKNNIKLSIFTPIFTNMVNNKEYYKVTKELYTKLLTTYIDSFYCLYFIDGISNYEKEGYYQAFYDNSHLNYIYSNNIFNKYIINSDDYKIDNINQLNKYLSYLGDISHSKPIFGTGSKLSNKYTTTNRHFSDTSLSGRVTASSWTPGYEPEGAFARRGTFDGKDAWLTKKHTLKGYIIYKTTKPMLLKSYRLQSRGVSEFPKKFTLEVSKDAINWIIIDTQNNISINNPHIYTKEFKINNYKKYSYFKLNIIKNNGNKYYSGFAGWELNFQKEKKKKYLKPIDFN